VDTLASDPKAAPAASPAEPEAPPAVLANLVAAGLVSHELIGDPARFADETAALTALCAKVSGAVYRLGPFHYAFRLGAQDLDGLLGSREPDAWGAAIEAAFASEFGPEAVWVSGTDLVTDLQAGLEARQVLFLKAAGEATAAALVEVPGLKAVINARFAALAAETTAALTAEAVERTAAAAGAESIALARRLDALAARFETLEAGLRTTAREAAEAATAAEKRLTAALEERLEAGLARIAAAVEAQGGALADQKAGQEALASGIAAAEASVARLVLAEADRAGALAAFEGRLGLTLAEFVAAIGAQTGSAAAAARIVEIAPEGAAAKGRLAQPAAAF
jgi:hypothetical protein